MNRRLFGIMPDGIPVEEYSLRCGKLTCDIITYGGVLRSLAVPDRNGRPVDVLLGFDHLEDYIHQDKYIGALIGRYANRIGKGRFFLRGKDYKLAKNDGENHLHGGEAGFDRRVWTAEAVGENTLLLRLTSPDGEEGYPGTMEATVFYRLLQDGLLIEYEARCDCDTLCNLTNHAYFNLSGHDSGTLEHQRIQIFADYFTPTDEWNIPTGEMKDVTGTPMDLREWNPIGRYDHNWILRGGTADFRLAAKSVSSDTGITMETWTTQPGIQFYTGDYLDGCPAGKGGAVYRKRAGFCLETQLWPDSPNHDNFPDPVLRAGQVYRHKTAYLFR